MEKFVKIADSIDYLDVFNAYRIVRLDIQLNTKENRFHAYLTMEGTTGKDQINIEIFPDGSFRELWGED